MIKVWIHALLSVLLVSMLSLIGVIFFLIKTRTLKKNLIYLVSFSIGGLFGGSFFHLLPESIKEIGVDLSINYLILGILFSFVVEMFLQWRHCHIATSEDHPHTFAYMNLIGDGVHNLIDGMVIGASYLTSTNLGLASTVAICLHELPQEIGDFGVLLYAGYKKRKALLFNFFTALTAILGLAASIILSMYVKDLISYFLPFAAGNFIYIAGSDLVPELHDQKELWPSLFQLIAMLFGLLLLYSIKLVHFDV